VGGQLAAPGKVVVSLVGDSAFAMNGTEVHSAVENNVPVIWIVLNDGGHAMIMHGETLLLGRHLEACRFRVPIDISGLGAALGARSFRVDTVRGFREAFQEALASRVPCVIDAIVDPKEVPRTLSRRVRTLAASFDHVPISLRQPRR
jgi:acetolactate synthase-1/2/3 large subunit